MTSRRTSSSSVIVSRGPGPGEEDRLADALGGRLVAEGTEAELAQLVDLDRLGKLFEPEEGIGLVELGPKQPVAVVHVHRVLLVQRGRPAEIVGGGLNLSRGEAYLASGQQEEIDRLPHRRLHAAVFERMRGQGRGGPGEMPRDPAQ